MKRPHHAFEFGDVRNGDFRVQESDRDASGPTQRGPRREKFHDPTTIDICARKVAIHLANREFGRARLLIDRYEAGEETDGPGVRPDSPLVALGLPLHVSNLLEKYREIRTVEDLVNMPRTLIESTPNIGPKTLADILRRVASLREAWAAKSDIDG